MAADRVAGAIAEDLLGPAIEMDDALAMVDRDDRVGGDRQDAGEFCFGCPQVFLNPLLLAEPHAEVQLLEYNDDQRGPSDQRWNGHKLTPPTRAPASKPVEHSRTGGRVPAPPGSAACR